MILTATTQALELVLGAAGSVEWTAAWTDLTDAAATPGAADGLVTSTAATAVLPSPAAATQRRLECCTFFNGDTAPAQITLRLNNNSSLRRVWSGTIPPGGTLSWSRSGGWSVPGTGTGGLSGTRNKIINGKMEIAQRGTSFAAVANGAYTLDRWVWGNGSSAAVTIAQSADAPSGSEFQSSLRATVTTADASVAASDLALIRQRVEGFNVSDLIGRPLTLSFWVRSAKTGTHCVALVNAAGNRTYIAEYTVAAVNTWERKSITVAGGLITAGTWDWASGIGLSVDFALMCGSAYQTTAGAWQTGTYLASAAQANVMDTVGNVFAVTGVQLEAGSAATGFEHRPYGAELALCQRYYQVGGFNSFILVQTIGPSYPSHSFIVTMRAAPTVQLLPSGGSGGSVSVDSTGFYQSANHSYASTCAWNAAAEL